MNWTQPTCGICWRQRHGDEAPVHMVHPDAETCCFCGAPTNDGIYVRVDPRIVKFPKGDRA